MIKSKKAVRLALIKWYQAQERVTVRQLSQKVCIGTGTLLFKLNKGQKFKYSEGMIVDAHRFRLVLEDLVFWYEGQSSMIGETPKRTRRKRPGRRVEIPFIGIPDEYSWRYRPVGASRCIRA